jgi:hypothetical protein
MSYIPTTRTCVELTINGVPLGTQVAWLSSNSTGMAFDVTRVADVVHCPVTQGTGEPETLKGQPATA